MNTKTTEIPAFKAAAKWVADLLKADGITPEQFTPDLALAYHDEVGRRIAKIQTIYMTRTGARPVMQAMIARAAIAKAEGRA